MRKSTIITIVGCSLLGVGVGATGTAIGIKYYNSNKYEIDTIDNINHLLSIGYYKVNILTSTKLDDLELKSYYDIFNEKESTKVSYSVEKFSEFDIENNVFPEKYKQTIQGEKILEDKFTLNRFKFNLKTFKNEIISKYSYKASISNGKNYLKADYNLYNFEITFEYNSNGINKINYNYIDDNNAYNEVLINITKDKIIESEE